jgi:nucleoside-diphosphate-sugar epimerase
MEGEKGRVCVTGGTGFVASWLIMKLLEQGYSVNTTVRPHPGKFSIYLFPLMLGQMKNFNIIKLIH